MEYEVVFSDKVNGMIHEIEVIVNLEGGILTKQKVNGSNVFFSFDYYYGKKHKDRVVFKGFSCTREISNSARTKGFPSPVAQEEKIYAGVHLITLKKYCKEKGLRFVDESCGMAKTLEHNAKGYLADLNFINPK